MSHRPTARHLGHDEAWLSAGCRFFVLLLSLVLVLGGYSTSRAVSVPASGLVDSATSSSAGLTTDFFWYGHSVAESCFATKLVACDALSRIEIEELDSLEEEPGHPTLPPVAESVSFGSFRQSHPPRLPSLPFLSDNGLMSRRF